MGMIKTADEIQKMRDVAHVTAFVLDRLIKGTKIGDTGYDINQRAHLYFKEAGVESAFYGLYDFPGQLCVSVNESLIHGIPDSRPFKSGDVIKYDIGARWRGYCSDMARTFILGRPKAESHVLLLVDTLAGLDAGIEAIVPGATLRDIGRAVEKVAAQRGYGNVTSFHGHGIGQNVHEEPAVHNCVEFAKPIALKPGMVLALEPMFVLGSPELQLEKNNKWLIKSVDNAIGAHFEDTVLVTAKGHEILTRHV